MATTRRSRHPYLPADFRADAKDHNIVASVHMEAEWDTSDEVGETRWLATLRATHGLPTVAIGHTRFEDPGIEEVLAGQAADLAHALPRTPILVNHTGLPSDRSLDGPKAWRQMLERVARVPNGALKISGLGQRAHSWPRDANRQVVRDAITIFGTDRCMFASNYPVGGLCVGYRALFDDFKRFVADRSPVERIALFHDNAARIYRIAAGDRGA